MKKQYLADNRKTPVVPMKKLYRVAAALIILLGAAAIYKYASVSSKVFFTDHYIAYELPVNRGEANPSGQDLLLAYGQKNWKEVVRLYDNMPVKNNQYSFLAGIAEMELSNYGNAIRKFEVVLNNTGDHYYEDEAGFYLAMALLANDQPEEAIAVFQKIKSDPGHLYAERVKSLSQLDLFILKSKVESKKK